ncbi:MAG: polysaccharide biosynthesis tyrosine autokinase [Dysgonamonadaceae bacterium]|jgi:capsular exopolysaccharide synthesis family protein|nr:polysaccharide biosynthesis tyrosine autokinase [Dysgonamonadaceae bacterium]
MEETSFLATNENEISFVELLFRYISEWKLFVISVAICFGFAITYILFTAPKYKVVSTILINDGKKGNTGQDMMTVFNDLGIFQQQNNFDNEIEIMRSQTLMSKVVDSLNLDVVYLKDKGMKTLEIYDNTPFFVTVKDCMLSGSLTFDLIDDETLLVSGDDFHEEIEFGKELMTPFGLITVTKNLYGTETCPIIAEIFPNTLPEIKINPVNKTSSVVEISIITGNREKGKDIINTMIDIYNNDAITEKNYVASNTITYIDKQLNVISGELNEAEKDVERYRKNANVMDLQAQGQLLLTSTADYINRINSANTQLLILQKTRLFITNPENSKNIVPSNDGLTDPTILGLIQAYNAEILNKEKQTTGMKDNFPIVKEFNKRISTLRENLRQGINNLISSVELTIRELRRQEGMYRSEASALPTKDRESRGLLRQQNTKEFIANYLSQKREETGLALALATPNAKIIDAAKASKQPVKPVKSIIIFAALVAGLVISVIIIYLKELFNTKIHNQEDVQKTVKAAFLGKIPVSKNNEPLPVSKLRSSIAENFRLISSNIDFIIGNKKTKIISVTSSIPLEGKSFVARNLAYSLASIGKKTLLFDIDLRNSVVRNILDIQYQKGTTMYLVDSSVKLNEVIDTGKYHKNLDIIAVKIYPPNPTELLYSDRLAQLFAELEQLNYEYIIVDTAPVALVSDSFIVNRFTDATIFVLRAEYTEKSLLKEVQDIYKNNKLNHLAWVLNAVPESRRYGYGYGYKHSKYGYYYNSDEK